MAAIWGRAKRHDQCRALIAGRLLGSTNGTSLKTRSMRPSRQSSTPTTTSPFPVLHADTQGQSEPVFALAHLLGIELMPRIRNWKNIDLCRPDRKARYEHIDSLFSE